MEWEYQNQGPVDISSPFAQISQKSQMASFESPSKFGARQGPNPFAAASTTNQSPLKSQQPQPPHSSFFTPQIQRQYTGPSFRNPAFTTPQRRVEDPVFSEMSGIEDSPAMTDTSEVPADTPDVDRSEDFAKMIITPATANRTLFGRKTPGKGEVPRGKLDLHQRDKVRKRKRQLGDKDVGSVRSRLPHDSVDSESDWDGHEARSRSPHKGRKEKEAPRPGWFRNFLGAMNDNPAVPLILSRWVQLSVNVFIIGVFMWLVWGFIAMMRADLNAATEAERAKLLAEMEACAHEYTKNRCAPKSERLPALAMVCDEWELCMNRDPTSVMRVQVSAKNVAHIINEFCGAVSLKAWGFILTTILVAIIANNIGFGRYAAPPPTSKPEFHPPQQPDFPMLTSPQRDPNQAYIFAPIGQTPRHIRRAFLPAEATDTDASPDYKAILPPPQTPSGRRSPSKGDRGRSPTKSRRSPSKGY